MKFLIGVALFAVGCSAAKSLPAPSKLEEVAVFASQLEQCENTSQSKAQAATCRAGVEKFWCGSGGPLASSAGCDAVDGGVK